MTAVPDPVTLEITVTGKALEALQIHAAVGDCSIATAAAGIVQNILQRTLLGFGAAGHWSDVHGADALTATVNFANPLPRQQI